MIPATVRIGVTGHRDLKNEEKIRAAIRQVLNHIDELIKKHLPNARYSYAVISPLAEGADRLVAEEVLIRKPSGMEGKPTLEVPLPFPRDQYLKTFQGGKESEKEFEELLNRATNIEVLSPAKDNKDGYLQVGQHVVENCDVLIAIWDGKPAHGRGGTGNIVAYAREKNHPMFWIDSNSGEIHKENLHPEIFKSLI